MTQPLVSEPCDTPDRVTIFMDVTDRPYFGRFLTTIADADERRMTTRRYRRRRRSNGRSRTYPVTGQQDLRNHLATGTTRDSRALNNAFRDQLRAVELV